MPPDNRQLGRLAHRDAARSRRRAVALGRLPAAQHLPAERKANDTTAGPCLDPRRRALRRLGQPGVAQRDEARGARERDRRDAQLPPRPVGLPGAARARAHVRRHRRWQRLPRPARRAALGEGHIGAFGGTPTPHVFGERWRVSTCVLNARPRPPGSPPRHRPERPVHRRRRGAGSGSSAYGLSRRKPHKAARRAGPPTATAAAAPQVEQRHAYG